MLHLTAADRLDTLVDAVAAALVEPQADVFSPEWIVVNTQGVDRWLRNRLARRLGASNGTDGIATNIDTLFPGQFRSRVLGRPEPGTDPWDLQALPWVVLQVLHDQPDLLRVVPGGNGGAPWGRARRIADLFDRYLLHRPDMVAAWAANDSGAADVDAGGNALPQGHRHAWQPELFRAVRRHIGTPSPAETLRARIEGLRSGDIPADVPERIVVFGIASLTGGRAWLDLVDAVSEHRDVHVLFHHSSPGLGDTVRAQLGDGVRPGSRRGFRDTVAAGHPLLRSWARPALETEALLHGREIRRLPDSRGDATTLLGHVQADLRADRPPRAAVGTLDDGTLTVHAAHGRRRQVEVLRDELLRLLRDRPDLTEDDIVVLCPDLASFAPLVRAVFGPPAPSGTDARSDAGDPGGAPALAYRIGDRSLTETVPTYAAFDAMVALLGTRFGVGALRDLLQMAPVARRLALGPNELGTIDDWLTDADVRWGLDAVHRTAWSAPADYDAGTWQHMLDRLLVGAVVLDRADAPTTVGGVVPLHVEGSDIDIAGRVADLVARLAALDEFARAEHPIGTWVARLIAEVDALLDSPRDDRWQLDRLREDLRSLVPSAAVAGSGTEIPIGLADLRRILRQGVGRRTTGRTDFFRGGVTVTSLVPLRGVPFRVVALLGLDDQAFIGGDDADGDDLTTLAPLVGDPDRRADVRHGLLDALLAADDAVVVLRTGHDLVTDRPVPPSVVVAELLGTVGAHLDVTDRNALETRHPRQSFDPSNFDAASPRSFDTGALAAAEALRDRPLGVERTTAVGDRRRPATEPGDDVELIDLADLLEFLRHPVRYHLQRIIGLTLPAEVDTDAASSASPVDGRDLQLDLDGLQRWKLVDGLLVPTLHGVSPGATLDRARRAGALPPGRYGERSTDQVERTLDLIAQKARSHAVDGSTVQTPFDVTLTGGRRRLTGVVTESAGDERGPYRLSASKAGWATHLYGYYANAVAVAVELCALTAADPSVTRRGVLVGAPGSKTAKSAQSLVVTCSDAADARNALEAMVDLFVRGRAEPLPLFPRTSAHIVHERLQGKAASPDDWSRDGSDRWNRHVLGDIAFEDLLRLPVQPHDPAPDDRASPNGGRVEHYGWLLWGPLLSAVTPAAKPAKSSASGKKR